MNKIKKITGALIDALEEWYHNPEEQRKIYNQHLKGLMDYDTWLIYQKLYDTPDKLQKIKPYSNDIKGLSKDGFVRKLEQSKLKEIVTKHISITKDEARQYYNKEYPKIIYWNIIHIFHKDKNIIKKVANLLKETRNLDKTINVYKLEKNTEGGFKREILYPAGFLPIYAKSLKELSEGGISDIYYGPLHVERESKAVVHEKEEFYYFIYVESINREKIIPNFAQVEDSIQKKLLADKKEKACQKWLKEKNAEANIEILDAKYKDILNFLSL